MSNQKWKQCGLCAFNVPENAKICGHCHARFILVKQKENFSIFSRMKNGLFVFVIEWVVVLAFVQEYLASKVFWMWVLLIANIPLSYIIARFMYSVEEGEEKEVEIAVKD